MIHEWEENRAKGRRKEHERVEMVKQKRSG